MTLNETNTTITPPSNRCAICNKRIGLMVFKCECNEHTVYCAKHAVPENHNCPIDYYEKRQKQLETKNIKVLSNRVIKL